MHDSLFFSLKLKKKLKNWEILLNSFFLSQKAIKEENDKKCFIKKLYHYSLSMTVETSVSCSYKLSAAVTTTASQAEALLAILE